MYFVFGSCEAIAKHFKQALQNARVYGSIGNKVSYCHLENRKLYNPKLIKMFTYL